MSAAVARSGRQSMAPYLASGRRIFLEPGRCRVLSMFVLVVGLSFVSVWAPAEPANAACTTQVDPISAMRWAESVFIGRVVMVEDLNRVARMEVVEVWKGRDLFGQVVVSGSLSGQA